MPREAATLRRRFVVPESGFAVQFSFAAPIGRYDENDHRCGYERQIHD
jgi:hypothetical protein